MDTGRWRKVQQLFQARLEAGTSSREALLDRLSDEDAELRDEVLALVDAHHAAGDFLAEPAFHLFEPDRTPDRIGPYRIVSELGRGGMGTVLLAERDDDVFHKRVAIKVLRLGLEPEDRERFALERQALGQLEHPNVARIYDGGTLPDDRPYLVMELVQGLRIDRYCDDRRLPVTGRVRLFLEVCEAVRAAHRQLIVHGDLKPSNILVTSEGAPRLIDFGISSRLGGTASASRLTLAYASPEHLHGAPLSAESDVYSLGVVLFELLSGHRPFRLEHMDVDEARRTLADTTPARASDRVLEPSDDAARPVSGRVLAERRATTPRNLRRQLQGDLDAILAHALAAEPPRRYGSVHELREDLERFLAGEPISLRPRTVAYLAAKSARRNPRGASLVALAPLALGAAGVLRSRSRRRYRRRALAEHRLAERGRALLATRRLGSLLPRTEGAQHRRLVEAAVASLQDEVDEIGHRAKGAGQFALACGYSTLDRYDQARRCLEAALAEGFDPPEVSLLLGKTLWILYLEELGKAHRLADALERRRRLDELRSTYRTPALHHLRIAERAGGEELLYVRGLIAYYDGELDGALELASAALHRAPWLYEAKQLEAEVSLARAKEPGRRGDLSEAESHIRAAGEAYAAALAIGRSDAQIWSGEAARRAEHFELHGGTLSDPTLSVEEAIEPARIATELAPGLVGPYLSRARVFWRWSDLLERQGRDPRDWVQRTVDEAQAAARLDPDLDEAQTLIAMAATVAIRWQTGSGADPSRWHELGRRTGGRAIELRPTSANAHNIAGNLALAWARQLNRSGGDPYPPIQDALGRYLRATQLDPDNSKYRANLALAFATQANMDAVRGRDPERWVAQADREAGRALDRNPREVFAWGARANAFADLAAFRVFARCEAASTMAALDDHEAALAGLGAAGPAHEPWAAIELAENRRLRALWALRLEEDPTPWIAEGLRAAQTAAERMPDQVLGLQNLAQLHTARARFEITRGRSPGAALAEAGQALEGARDKLDAGAGLAVTGAEGWWLLALWSRRIGADPAESIRRARSELRRIAEADHFYAHALALEAALLHLERPEPDEGEPSLRVQSLLSSSARRNPRAPEEALGVFRPTLGVARSLAGRRSELPST